MMKKLKEISMYTLVLLCMGTSTGCAETPLIDKLIAYTVKAGTYTTLEGKNEIVISTNARITKGLTVEGTTSVSSVTITGSLTVSSMNVLGDLTVGTTVYTKTVNSPEIIVSTARARGTSLHFYGDSTIFNTNGGEKLRLLSGGNLGIGRTNPTEKLEVSGNISNSGTIFSSGTVNAYFGSTVVVQGLQCEGDITNVNNLTATNIQVSTTGLKTDIYTVGETTGNLRYNILYSSTAILESKDISLQSQVYTVGETTGNIVYNILNSTSAVSVSTYLNKTTTDTAQGLIVNGTIKAKGSENNYLMGNVGIGTTEPTSKLEVKGSVSNSGVLWSSAPIHIVDGSNIGLEIGNTSGRRMNLLVGNGSTYDANSTYLFLLNSAFHILAGANGTIESLFVNNTTGNVGIGSVNPVSKLYMSSGCLTIDGNVNNSIVTSGNIGIGVTNPTGWLQVEQGTLTVTRNGRVGIGTTNPTGTLSLTTFNDGMLHIKSTSSLYGFETMIMQTTVDGDILGTYPAGSERYILALQPYCGRVGIGIETPLGTFEVSTGTNKHNLIVANVTGNVGINTSNPAEILDVRGNISNSGIIFSSGTGTSYFGSTVSVVGIKNVSILQGTDTNTYIDFNTADKINFWANGANQAFIESGYLTMIAGKHIYLNSGSNIEWIQGKIQANNPFGLMVSTGLYINGNVGIGVSNPVGWLQVEQGTFTILQNGRIGAGTTNPSNWFHIKNQSVASWGNVAIQDVTDAPTLSFWNSSVRVGLIDYASPIFRIRPIVDGDTLSLATINGNVTINKDTMTITSLGNVGIGRTNPTEKLEVSGNISLSGTVFSTGTTSAYFGSTPTVQGLVANGTINIKGTEKSYLMGNFGIGTSTPANRLDILTTDDDFDGVTIRSSLRDDYIKYSRIRMGHYLVAEEPVTLIGGDSTGDPDGNTIEIGGGHYHENAVNQISFFTTADDTTVSGSLRARIKSDGRMGIGTADPTSVLDVNGLIVSTGAKINGDVIVNGNITANNLSNIKQWNSGTGLVSDVTGYWIIGSTTCSASFNPMIDLTGIVNNVVIVTGNASIHNEDPIAEASIGFKLYKTSFTADSNDGTLLEIDWKAWVQ